MNPSSSMPDKATRAKGFGDQEQSGTQSWPILQDAVPARETNTQLGTASMSNKIISTSFIDSISDH